MIDLNGTYMHNIDSKGRLTLPAKFRKVLVPDESVVTELVATINPTDECLYVFDSGESFNDWVASFFTCEGGFNPRNLNHVNARRALKERAMDITVDSAGRINIPVSLSSAVGIERDSEVTIIGNTGFCELWSSKRREQAKASIDLKSILFDC